MSQSEQWNPTAREGEDFRDMPLGEAVGQALGAASSCWSDLSGAGVFKSEQCKVVLDGLMAWLMDWESKVRKEANENTWAKAQVAAREALPELLHRYSEWLDQDGVIKPGSRTHEELVRQFLEPEPVNEDNSSTARE